MASSHTFIAAVLGLSLATTGCGRKEVPEAPEPVAEAPVLAPVPAPAPIAAPTPAPDTRLETLEARIHFAVDRWDLSPEARAILAAKVEILRSAPELTLRIEGHADERGSDEYNLALSKRRAGEVKRFLVTRSIDESRLESVGYGEEQPLDRTSSEGAWAMNRRAGFQVTGGSLSQR